MTEVQPTSPGSYDEFAAAKGLDPQARETLSIFTEAASEHRAAIARGLGLTLEELHVSPNPAAPEDAVELAA